jgi:chromosome segregation ATPase
MECEALKTELTQIKGDLIKTKQELEDSKNVIENFKCQYDKQRTENLPVKKQLEQIKSDNRRLELQFDKLTKDHEAVIKDLNHYKARSTGLAQELERLRLDSKNELDRYTNKEKLGMKMHEGAVHKNEEHSQVLNIIILFSLDQ